MFQFTRLDIKNISTRRLKTPVSYPSKIITTSYYHGRTKSHVTPISLLTPSRSQVSQAHDSQSIHVFSAWHMENLWRSFKRILRPRSNLSNTSTSASVHTTNEVLLFTLKQYRPAWHYAFWQFRWLKLIWDKARPQTWGSTPSLWDVKNGGHPDRYRHRVPRS